MSHFLAPHADGFQRIGVEQSGFLLNGSAGFNNPYLALNLKINSHL